MAIFHSILLYFSGSSDRQTRQRKTKSEAKEKAQKEKEKKEKEKAEKPKYKSTRKFFHEDEDFYVMDAKQIGKLIFHSRKEIS